MLCLLFPVRHLQDNLCLISDEFNIRENHFFTFHNTIFPFLEKFQPPRTVSDIRKSSRPSNNTRPTPVGQVTSPRQFLGCNILQTSYPEDYNLTWLSKSNEFLAES